MTLSALTLQAIYVRFLHESCVFFADLNKMVETCRNDEVRPYVSALLFVLLLFRVTQISLNQTHMVPLLFAYK